MTHGRADLPYAIVRGQNTTRFGYNTSDARIFKGDQTNARYYIPGIGSYDLSSKTWEHYPAGIAQIRDNVLNYTIKDHLTNIRAIVGTTASCTTPGTITAYDYYPYGKILRKYESVESRYKSTNHEKDSETGYDDRGARWWDDERLTPIQPDPHADKYPSLSSYSSMGCNPISIIDKDGKDIVDAQGRKAVIINKGQVQFTKYATNDIKDVVTPMLETKIGTQVAKDMIKAKHEISIILDRSEGATYLNASSNKTTKENTGKILYGHTKNTVEKGTTKFVKSEITVFEGTIQHQIDNKRSDNDVGIPDLSIFEKTTVRGSVGVHEGTHATDKESIRGANAEDKPIENEQKYYLEILKEEITKDFK
jgi:RHS repeat-associated protein